MKAGTASAGAQGRVPGLRLARGPLGRAVALVLLATQLAGCYTYVPATSTQMAPGARVSVAVTDRGRSELGERVGPGVRRLSGTVVISTDTSLVLSVSTVDFIDVPVPVRWNGDRIVVGRSLLSEVRERRLSRSRSWVMAGVLALVGVGLSTLALTGFGSDSDSDRSGEDDTHQ